MKKTICLTIAVLFVMTSQSFGWTYFNDGGIHNIDYTLGDSVQVQNGASGEPTTVNLLNGGAIGGTRFVVIQDSRINIYGGSSTRVAAGDNSQVTMSGGSVGGGYLAASVNAKITMTGGTVDGHLQAWGNGDVTISGGSVMWSLQSWDISSRVTMSGGSIAGDLYANGYANLSGGTVGGNLSVAGLVDWSGGTASGYLYACGDVNWSGGTLSGEIQLYYHAILALDGNNFAIDGVPFTSGEITSVLGGSYTNESYRRLTGTLSNGDIINNQFRIGDTAKIVLVPKPTIPPIADAGFDQTVMDSDDNGSELVTLNGSGSSDSDGTIVSWVWTDNLGDTIPDGEITTATLSVGIHTITLTVTDEDGLTDTDTVTVTVDPYPNQPPVADADGPYTIYVGGTLTLNASGSTDYDNDIASYLWDLDDNNSFETDAGNQPVFDVNFAYLQSLGLLVDNTYNIHLKVTDSVGQSDVNDTTLTILPIPALLVFVDIKPGSCPNPLNVKSSGVLPVAILGTADFDITTIDPTSIRLSGVEPLRSDYEDVTGPPIDSNDCNCTEEGPDGFLDLTLKFKTQKIVDAIGDVNEGDVLQLKLTGVLIGERPIEGADCILIRGKNRPFNRADLNKDGIVNSQDFVILADNWLQSSIIDD